MKKSNNNKEFSGIQIIGIGDNIVDGFKEYFPEDIILSVCGHDSGDHNEEDIHKSIDCNSKTVFIITDLGGEHSIDVATLIARKCKEVGKVSIGIATLPFTFEGATKYEQALCEAHELLRNTDATFFLNNQSLLESNREMSVSEALKKRDLILCQIIKGINEVE